MISHVNFVIVARAHDTAGRQSQVQALPDVAVRVQRRPRVLYRAQARLVPLARAGLANPVEERHRAVLRQPLNVRGERRLRGVPRYHAGLAELALRLIRLLGRLVHVPAAPLRRRVLEVEAVAVARCA